jgi:hypothetical protein
MTARLWLVPLLLLLTLAATASEGRQRLSRQAAARSESCQAQIPACAATVCPTRLLANRETVVCPRCLPGYVAVRGSDGASAIQCGEGICCLLLQRGGWLWQLPTTFPASLTPTTVLVASAMQSHQAGCCVQRLSGQSRCSCSLSSSLQAVSTMALTLPLLPSAVCPAGTYQVLSGGSRTCTGCPLGSFCPGGVTNASSPTSTSSIGGELRSCNPPMTVGLTTRAANSSSSDDCGEFTGTDLLYCHITAAAAARGQHATAAAAAAAATAAAERQPHLAVNNYLVAVWELAAAACSSGSISSNNPLRARASAAVQLLTIDWSSNYQPSYRRLLAAAPATGTGSQHSSASACTCVSRGACLLPQHGRRRTTHLLTRPHLCCAVFTAAVAIGGYVLPATAGGAAQQCTGATYAPALNQLRQCLQCAPGLGPPLGLSGRQEDEKQVCREWMSWHLQQQQQQQHHCCSSLCVKGVVLRSAA